jgi:[acyl-carrier-protein] S-malonyltransferase
MAAVIGLDFPEIIAVLEKSGIKDLYAANYNSPSQTVVSGTAEALNRAEDIFRAAGAKRCIRLKVSGPFHSPLLGEARKEFEAELEKYTFADPEIPIYSNVTAGTVTSGAEAKRLAGLQITSPVLWVNTERNICRAGCERVLEVGPGMVLSGLWKALYPDLPCLPAGKVEEIDLLTL